MRKFKKTLAMLLSVAMAFTMAPAITLTTASAAAVTIDPSNLTDWKVYTHYIDPSWTLNTSNQGSRTFQKPANWDTLNPLHPFSYYYENAGKPSVFIDPLTKAGRDQINNQVLGKGGGQSGGDETRNFMRHIYADGTLNAGEITFLGYGYSGNVFTDFAIAPIDASNNDIKSIGFDIDAANFSSHSMYSFGILMNADVVNDLLYGYALNFYVNSGTSGYVMLMRLDGVDVNLLWSTSNSGILFNGSTPVANATVVQSNLVTFDLAGGNGMFRCEVEIAPNYVDLLIADKFDNQPDVTIFKDQVAFPVDTNHRGFGLFAQYKSHSCSTLTSVRFSEIQMTVDYSVFYHLGYDVPGADDDVFDRENGIKKNTSLKDNDRTLPSVPKRDGYAFVGWTTEKGGTVPNFDENTIIDKAIYDVYAIWAKAGLDVKYTPSAADYQNVTAAEWTNVPTVDVEFTVTAPSTPLSLTLNIGGSNVTVSGPVDNGNGTYTYKYTTPVNFTGGKVTAVVDDGQGGTFDIVQDVNVTWLDRVNPTITSTIGEREQVTPSSFTGKVTFADTGDAGFKASEVDNSTRTLYLYKDGAPAGTHSWSDLSNASLFDNYIGVYTYDIKVVDNAGNITYYNSGPVAPGETDPGPDPDGPEVVINAEGPAIDGTLTKYDSTGDKGAYTSATWTNTSVRLDYYVSSVVDLDYVLENEGSGDANVSIVGGTSHPHEKSKNYTETGKYMLQAKTANIVGTAESVVWEIWIDKIAPTITYPAGTLMDADYVKNIEFADADSGIDDATKNIVIRDLDNPSKTYTVDQLNAGAVPTGNYEIETTVRDVATNESKKTSDALMYVNPSDPTGGVTIDITATPTNWTNGDVDLTYTVTSVFPVQSLTIDGVTPAGFTAGDKTYTLPGDTPINYTTKIVVGTAANSSNNDEKLIPNIDKLAPVITGPADNSSISDPATAFMIYDQTATAVYGMSDINHGTIKYTLYEYNRGVPSQTPSMTCTQSEFAALSLTSLAGKVFDIVVYVEDNATNATEFKATGVTFVDDTKPLDGTVVFEKVQGDGPNTWFYTAKSDYPILQVNEKVYNSADNMLVSQRVAYMAPEGGIGNTVFTYQDVINVSPTQYLIVEVTHEKGMVASSKYEATLAVQAVGNFTGTQMTYMNFQSQYLLGFIANGVITNPTIKVQQGSVWATNTITELMVASLMGPVNVVFEFNVSGTTVYLGANGTTAASPDAVTPIPVSYT